MKKRRILIKILLVVFLLLVIGVIGVSIYFEKIAKNLVISQLEGMGFQVSLGDLNLALFRGQCSLSELDLKTEDSKPLLSLATLQVDTNFWKALSGEVVVSDVRLDNLKANGAIDGEGSLNWVTIANNLKEKSTKESSQGSKYSFDIQQLNLKNLEFKLTDARKDTPLEDVDFTVGNLSVNMKQGDISVENVQLKSSQPQPYISIESLKTQGKIDLAASSPVVLSSIDVRGLKARNQLNPEGQLILVQWLNELAQTNGLLAESPVKPQDASPKKKTPLPDKISLADLNFQLIYPAEDKGTWLETVNLARLDVDLKKHIVNLSELEWSDDVQKFVKGPILSIGKLNLEGDLLSEPLNLNNIKVDSVAINVSKGPDSPPKVLSRLNRLMEFLPESDPNTPPPAIRGSVEANTVLFRVAIVEGDRIQTDNILTVEKFKVGFDSHDLQVKQFLLSNPEGSLDDPTIAVKSIEGRGNWSYPLPEKWVLESISVDSPKINLVRNPEGKLDLVQRLDQLKGGLIEQDTAPTTETAALDFQSKSTQVQDLNLNLLHQLSPEKSVKYEIQPGQMKVEELIYSKEKQGARKINLEGTLIAPSPGSFNLAATIPEQKKIDNFSGKIGFALEDINGLRPYYENTLPFEIQGGQFTLGTEGSCKDRQLNFPYDLSLIAPELEAKGDLSQLGIQKISQSQAKLLLDSLKDKSGNISYKGNLTGTLDQPKFYSPWKEMGNLFSKQLVKNINLIPGLEKTLQGSTTLFKDTTGNIGNLLKSVPQAIVPKKKEQQ